MSYCLIFFAAVVGVFLLIWRLRKLHVSRLDSKPVLITGCDSGFGLDLCKHLDETGVPVIATVFLEESVAHLKKILSDKCLVLQLDVTDHSSILKVLKEVEAFLNASGHTLWGLVNNAGICDAFGPAEWFAVEDFQRHLNVNTLGMIDMCLSFMPLLKRSKGRIVNMVSISGRFSSPLMSPYCMSKFASRAFSECLHREMSAFGLSVHIIEPGFHKTAITDSERIKRVLKEYYSRFAFQEQYGEEFVADIEALVDFNMNFAVTSTKYVVDAYVNALFSRFPKRRYLVGFDARVGSVVALLPDWIIDIFHRFLGHKGPRLDRIRLASSQKID